VNLIPFLSGQKETAPHKALMWRWVSQSAIRQGDWKLLRGGDREYLYNLHSDLEEKNNVADEFPEVADQLRQQLTNWSQQLEPPGLATAGQSTVWNEYYDFYLEGKPAKTSARTPRQEKKTDPASTVNSWLVRSGTLTLTKDSMDIVPHGKKSPALIRNGIQLTGPIKIEMTFKSVGEESIQLHWRNQNEKTFVIENRLSIPIEKSSEWQTLSVEIPSEEHVVHVRFNLPAAPVQFRSLELSPSKGKSIRLLNSVMKN